MVDYPAGGAVTRLLGSLRRGEPVGDDAAFTLVYEELCRLAHEHRAQWRGNATLDTSALVHEAYLKLVGGTGDVASRVHFLALAARAMRHILITYAERQRAHKRGGGTPNLPLDEAFAVPEARAEELLSLDEALDRLARADRRAALIVECRFFGGLTAEETASALGVSTATVTRGWRAARAWLYGELQRDVLTAPPPGGDRPG